MKKEAVNVLVNNLQDVQLGLLCCKLVDIIILLNDYLISILNS